MKSFVVPFSVFVTVHLFTEAAFSFPVRLCDMFLRFCFFWRCLIWVPLCLGSVDETLGRIAYRDIYTDFGSV